MCFIGVARRRDKGLWMKSSRMHVERVDKSCEIDPCFAADARDGQEESVCSHMFGQK